jgi:uncharacterized protein (UPF0548 family)
VDLVLAARPLGEAACARWARMRPSSPPSGPRRATVDAYVGQARVRPGETPEAVFERVRGRILGYQIFPPRLVGYTICPAGPVQVGAIIVQRLRLGPFGCEMAVRVIDVWDTRSGGVADAGFQYVTLRGHAECGIASFGVRLEANGTVTVRIDVRSRAGLLLTQLGRPVARRVQQRLTRAALARLCRPDGPG